MQQLAGKTVLITGGNSGIGLATAKRFVKEGAFVFITGRRQTELNEAVKIIGENVQAIPGDITSAADRASLFARIKEQRGSLDSLVVNAGTSGYAAIEDVDQQHFDNIFDLNAKAAFFTVQGAIELMPRGGSVVLIGSIASAIGNPGYGIYSASKAAVRSFSRTWTLELAHKNIRVNTLSPGPTVTPLFDSVTEEIKQSFIEQIPLGRMGRPEEIAAAALFLASEESSYIAGVELFIDGGMQQV